MGVKSTLLVCACLWGGVNQSLANSSCPQTETEFVSWFKAEMLKQPNPEKMSVAFFPLAKDCERRLQTCPTHVTQACLKPLAEFRKGLLDETVSVFSERKAVKALVLPQAFAENSLAQALDSAATPQSEIDTRLAKLSAKLPKGSRVMQFTSGATDHRSWPL